MAGLFEGKVVLVTGAAGGIGRATALAFAREGAKITAVDILVHAGRETVRMAKDIGAEATFIKTDLCSGEEIEAMVGSVVERYGRLDAAVNSAGIEGEFIPTAEYAIDIWDQVLRVNLTGLWLCMKHEIRQMLKQGGGTIVNVASVAGIIGLPANSAYVASKHGVNGITKVAALEYAKANIRVNSVCPGFVDTGMLERCREKVGVLVDTMISASPAGRRGNSEEIAQSAIWLCSDRASFVTGHTMVVDGGYVAQ